MILIKSIYKTIVFWCTALISTVVLLSLIVLPVFLYFSKDLPDYHQLTQYDPPTISRIYSAEGDLMAELASERRIFRKINEIPQTVVNAFIAAEDQNYYNHPGIDIVSIVRAAMQNLINIGSDRNAVGGSTITQQVVKNFLLTNERSISRKIKEAILAYRINKVYSKDRILELYLNQIYLGNGAYGVTSAALSYYNKDLTYVTIEEAALLAALPKAPTMLDPTKYSQKVKPRRNWVIDRMLDEKFITDDEAITAKNMPIVLNHRYESSILDSGYYTESVRLEMIEKYGYDHVYQEGFSVYTNLNKQLQVYADNALRAGLIAYDRRHGFCGPLTTLTLKDNDWQSQLSTIENPKGNNTWQLGIVISIENNYASIGLKDMSIGQLTLNDVKWARKRLKGGYVGKEIESIKDVLKIGDVILIGKKDDKHFTLEQIPAVNGSLIAIQPKTGKVLAMSGGYSFKDSKYNRATQALRQPGSAFKPFVYLAALEKGYTPTTLLKDEPISISQGYGKPMWTPKNYEGRFLGTITLRKALEKSRNLATVDLIVRIGANSVGQMATRLKVYDKDPPPYYSMALGAGETTLLKLTSAFATFANEGTLVEPKLIDHVQDRKGNIIFNNNNIECQNCGGNVEPNMKPLGINQTPTITRLTKNVIEPTINYQLVNMLQGAVERGTAGKARKIGKVIAGKTGTSNDSNDTWFIGFSPDLAVGVFVGYDNPRSLGNREQGSSVALPIFIDFMTSALKNMPNNEFRVPEGIKFVNVDYDTGNPLQLNANGTNVIKEPVTPGSHLLIDELENLTPQVTNKNPSRNNDENNSDEFNSLGIY